MRKFDCGLRKKMSSSFTVQGTDKGVGMKNDSIRNDGRVEMREKVPMVAMQFRFHGNAS